MDEREVTIRERTDQCTTRKCDVSDCLDLHHLLSIIDTIRAERDKWLTVVRATMDTTCPEYGCDSYGHVDECGIAEIETAVSNLVKRAEAAETKCVRMERVVTIAQKHRIEGCGDPLLIEALDALAEEGSK